MLLGSLDRFVEHRIHMYKAVILLRQWKFAKVSHQMKKKILAEKVEFPMGGMTCLLLEATASLRLQGRQYYIQCNR